MRASTSSLVSCAPMQQALAFQHFYEFEDMHQRQLRIVGSSVCEMQPGG